MSKATTTRSTEGPRVIALGSGSGGAGRTTLALELARVLGRRNVRTLLVDCALSAPALAPALGRAPRRTVSLADLFEQAGHVEDQVLRVAGEPVAVLTLTRAVDDLEARGAGDPARLMGRLRRLQDAVVLLDLPPGPLPFWLDVMALADVPVVVTGPDGWSVAAALPFIERLRQRSRALALDRSARSYLLVNGCRDASERDLGEVLCHAIWRRLGHYPRYLGPIDYDDRRWFHLRRGDGCPPLSGSAGLGVQVEGVVKRILGLDDFDERRPRGEDQSAGAHFMGMSETASAADLRAQYRRLWEGYRRDSAISQVLFEADERAAIIEELERTYRALQMALDERASSRTPSSVARVRRQAATRPRAPVPVRTAVRSAAPLEAADSCGALLVKTREAVSLSLRELSLRTRIGMRYLEAIESMEIEALPPPVYLRGYLREIARTLGLPVDSLLERYLSELAEERKRTSSGLGA